jgi:hypothetical protein
VLVAATWMVLGAGVAQAAPAIATSPSLSGGTTVGDTIDLAPGTWTADPSATDSPADSDTWEECTDSALTNCSMISPTGTNSYQLSNSDVGDYIYVSETATDSTGTSSPVSSNAEGPIVADPPTATNGPTISGTVTAGQTLTETSHANWTDSPASYTYQWLSCTGSTCIAISGATASSYQVTAGGDTVGYELEEWATGSDATTSASPAISNELVPAVPTPSGAPTISGTVAAGDTLTEATHATWTPTPTSYTYQWLSCTGSTAAPACSAVSGATASSYLIPTGGDGSGYELQEKAVNTSGTSATAATSAILAPVVPTNTAVPTISGTVALGDALTAAPGTWNGSPATYAYQWLRTGVAISGATASTYTLTSADAGTTVTVQVTATNFAGTSAPADSAGTALVAAPIPNGAPGISGTPQVGDTLTESPTAHWGGGAVATLAEQWYLCDSMGANCAAIAGASATTYAPVSGDVGGYLLLLATASNAGGSAAQYSPEVGPVLNPNSVIPVPAIVAAPALSGTTQQGDVLSADRGAWSNNPGTFTYQWIRCSAAGSNCSGIGGATGASYTLSPDDVGSTVAAQVTASNAEDGTGGAATSQTQLSPTVTTPSSTSLYANPGSLVSDQGTTLIATVTTGTGSVSAAGSLNFTDNGAGIAGCKALSLPASGQSATVTCRTSFLASNAGLVATYMPRAGSLATGSSSPVAGLTVGRARPRVSLSGSNPAINVPNVYKVTLSSPSGSLGTTKPTGVVRFLDGKKTIAGCGARRASSGQATCRVTYRALGNHRIRIAYAGDRNFSPLTSNAKTVAVRPATPTGVVSSLMNWNYRYRPGYTTFSVLSATGLVPGTRITLTCNGRGCPFHRDGQTIAAAKGCNATAAGCNAPISLNLMPFLRRAHLRPGTVLIVEITHTRWIGKYYRFVIVGGAAPQHQLSCLAVNSSRPGVGCST